MRMALNTASAALDEIAWLMPDACSTRAPLIRSAGTSSEVMRLAADPARMYEKTCPSAPWVMK
jgi:hypothetical protein